MFRFILFSTIMGILVGMSPEMIQFFRKPKTIQIVEVEPFWEVNGTVQNEEELFETFYPPLTPLK